MDLSLELIEPDYPGLIPTRASDAHKYSHGTVLVVAGSERFPGAAVLATKAAARSGAGYVTLATPGRSADVAHAHLLSSPVLRCSDLDGTFAPQAIEPLLARAAEVGAVVLGPGLLVTDGTRLLVSAFLSRCDTPLVIDADALNVISEDPSVLLARTAPCVLTPHDGEASRLAAALGVTTSSDKVFSCQVLTGEGRAVVLKGPGTVTCDATRCARCPRGSAALATAGTGDVLSGVIGALLAAGLDPFSAGALGAYVHGRAGELAEARRGVLGTLAEDVLDELPQAFIESSR